MNASTAIAMYGAALLVWCIECRQSGIFRTRLPHAARNVAVTAMAIATGGLLASAVAFGTRVGGHWGLFEKLQFTPTLRIFIGIFAIDFVEYLRHRLSHAVPFLWRFHRVHHADEELDITSTFVFHPGEVVLTIALRVGAIVLLGIPVESLLIYQAIATPLAFAQHSLLKLPWLEPTLRPVFVTPIAHKIHHERTEGAIHANFGTVFIWWDYIWRTHQNVGALPQKYGLAELDGTSITFERLLCMPSMSFDKQIAATHDRSSET